MARKKRSDRAARRQRTQERMSKEGQGSGGSQRYDLDSTVKWFKPESETYNLDLVPYKVIAENNPFADAGELIHGRIIWVHYGLGPENISLICPKTIGKRCPVCEYQATLDWDEDEEERKAINASKRVLYNVIDNDNDPDEILFSEIAYGNFEELLAEEYAAAGDDDVILGLDFLDDRPTLEVRFKEAKFAGNKFVEASKITATEGDDFGEDILDDVVDLDACLIVLPGDEIQKIFLGLDEEEAPPEQKEEKKSSRRRSRKQEPEDTPEPEKKSSRRRSRKTEKESEPEKKEKTSKRRRSRGNKDEEKKPKSKCPHGHTWGADNDAFPKDCDECNVWDNCMDTKEVLDSDVPF